MHLPIPESPKFERLKIESLQAVFNKVYRLLLGLIRLPIPENLMSES